MKNIETKTQLDCCKLAAEFSCNDAFIIDEFKLVSEFYKIDFEDYRRANVVFHYRLNHGLKNNPYNKNDKMFKIYNLLLNNTHISELKKFLQFDNNPQSFKFIKFNKKDSKEIISPIKEIEQNKNLYPEAFIVIKEVEQNKNSYPEIC